VADFGSGIAKRVAGALACLAAVALPALASTSSVGLADGSTLTVWEHHGRAVPGRGPASWSINYAVTDDAGTRAGVVPPTADVARDSAPYLATDLTGSAVLVWSRFDGTYRKIAYARFSGGAWSNFHFLTFGPGDDDAPRVGTGMAGSFLFFLSRDDKYEFAPLDLMSGRLFAAPRALDLGSARRDIEPLRSPGTPTTQAGVDAPVTGVTSAKHHPHNATLLQIGSPGVQGGIDSPVTGNQHKASVWGIGSSGDCSRMILVIPAADLKSAFVFRFTSGSNSLLQRVELPAQVQDNFGRDLAASHLPFVCN
jgi:hypothetical protein